jgi:hypothetical protein
MHFDFLVCLKKIANTFFLINSLCYLPKFVIIKTIDPIYKAHMIFVQNNNKTIITSTNDVMLP